MLLKTTSSTLAIRKYFLNSIYEFLMSLLTIANKINKFNKKFSLLKY